MKKFSFAFLIVLLAFARCHAEPENRMANEPIQHLIQTTLDANPQLFSKNSSTKNYLESFASQWKDLLNQLFLQEINERQLEPFFFKNYEVALKNLTPFQRMKPPSEFKPFHEILARGIEELSDWSLDMRDRIRFAKTDYQKKAYMKRIEGFKAQWYDTFFGEALEELNNAMSAFLTSHWKDDLSLEQHATLKSAPEVGRYLNDYHAIIQKHLKTLSDISKKTREAKEKSKEDYVPPEEIVQNVKQELDDLRKTLAGIQKLSPPASFKKFHDLQLNWLDNNIRANQQILALEEAHRTHAPEEKVQALINEKNSADQEATRIKAEADKAYSGALKTATH